jgi:hypothetical protein
MCHKRQSNESKEKQAKITYSPLPVVKGFLLADTLADKIACNFRADAI